MMDNKIDINKALYETLKSDYITHKENSQYQSQLQSGFDYMEAMIKLFASISISVVKDIDEEIYKDIFTKNFKLTPSLGDFKSIVTVPFSKNSKKSLIKADTSNEIYTLLDTVFSQKISLELIDPNNILDDNNKTKIIKSTLQLLNEYAVSFRNKIKGHGASFKDSDFIQRDMILDNLDKLLMQLESNYNTIYQNITFYKKDTTTKISMRYQDKTIELLPLISYIECDKYSCKKDHRLKIFFYNDGKESKSHYLDYSFNHYFQITQKNEIHQSIKELQEQVLHTTSDTLRQSFLSSNFVGRVEELKSTTNHILQNIQNSQSSFISIVGKPGIGKSAFLTQLQQNIQEDEILKENLNSYTFYAQKNNMEVEEDKYLYKKISAYIDSLGISVKQDEQFDMTIYLEKLFDIYENDKDTKPLLLIIDGLDEFSNPIDIIKKFPLNFSSKIHLIFSSRSYSNIKNIIASKLSNKVEQCSILNSDTLIKHGYSIELGKLYLFEVEELLCRVLSKEISRESEDYAKIVDTIAVQSESLPLYIYYITQELKEKNILDNQNISYEIQQWAKKLPPKLENFYQDMFKTVSPLARKILLTLYFSKTGVTKKDIYQILKNLLPNEFSSIDRIKFEEDIFNSIEIFLNIDKLDRYSFYHLSVKEAIQEYLKDQDELFTLNLTKLKDQEVLLDVVIEENQEYIKNIIYLDKDSDSYQFLLNLINYLKVNSSSKYYNENFFHLYNSLVWFNIFHVQISYEDMKDEKYNTILNTKELSNKNKEEVKEFFKLFDTKEDKHLFEIRYAYELAFIAEDYQKVLEYKDLYEDFINQLFLDICLNIDKVEYIEKFIKYKDDWKNQLNDYLKKLFIRIMVRNDKISLKEWSNILLKLDNNKINIRVAFWHECNEYKYVNSNNDILQPLLSSTNIYYPFEEIVELGDFAINTIINLVEDKSSLNDILTILKREYKNEEQYSYDYNLKIIANSTRNLYKKLFIINNITELNIRREAIDDIDFPIDKNFLNNLIITILSLLKDEEKSKILEILLLKNHIDIKLSLEIIENVKDIYVHDQLLIAFSEYLYRSGQKQYLGNFSELFFQEKRKKQFNDKNFTYSIDSLLAYNNYINSNLIDLSNKVQSLNILNKRVIFNIFSMNKTLLLISYLSPHFVLNYYNITLPENNSLIFDLLKQLSLNLSQTEDKKDKRKLFNEVKEQIIDDENLLNEFIKHYGEKFDITDEDSFDNEFSLKSFEDKAEMFQ
jgi:hypothetical protein